MESIGRKGGRGVVAFVCASERGKHKSRSRAITAARLETRECDECVLSIAISPLFCAHFVVLPLLTPRLAVCLSKRSGGGGMDSRLLRCHYPVTAPHSSTAANGTQRNATPYFLYFAFVSLSFPLRWKGCVALPRTDTPSHCKRMSLSQGKQSAFIMPYQRGPPSRCSRDTPAQRMCLGPVANGGSRSTDPGNGARTWGLLGELPFDLSSGLWRRKGHYPWSRITFFRTSFLGGRVFVKRCFIIIIFFFLEANPSLRFYAAAPAQRNMRWG